MPPNPKPAPQHQPQGPVPVQPGQPTDQARLEAALKRLADAMERTNKLNEQPPPAASSRDSGGFGSLIDYLPAPLKNLVKRYQDFAGRMNDLSPMGDAPPAPSTNGASGGKGNRPPTSPTGPNSPPGGPPGGNPSRPPTGPDPNLAGAAGWEAAFARAAGGVGLVVASLDAAVKTIRGFVQGMRDFTRGIADAGKQALEFNRQYAEVSPSMAMVMADYDVHQIFRKQRKGEALAPSAERLKDSQKTLEDTLEPMETWLEKMGNNVEAGLNNMKTDLTRLITFQWGKIGKYTTEEEDRAAEGRFRETFERFRSAGAVQPGQEHLFFAPFNFMLKQQAEGRKREIEATLDALGKQPGATRDEKGVPIGPGAEERKRLEGMLADILGVLAEIRDASSPGTEGGQTIAEFEANLKAEVEQRRQRQRQRQDQVSRDMRTRGLYG